MGVFSFLFPKMSAITRRGTVQARALSLCRDPIRQSSVKSCVKKHAPQLLSLLGSQSHSSVHLATQA